MMTSTNIVIHESPNYRGSCLEVETFDTIEEGVKISSIDTEEVWKYTTKYTMLTLNNVCIKLLGSDVSYGLVLEYILGKIIQILDADIGSITARSETLDVGVVGEPYLMCVALGEKVPGTLSSGAFDSAPRGHGAKAVDGIFGHSIDSDRAIISNDLSNDPRAKKEMPVNHPQIFNFIGIPLVYQGVKLGLLAIASCEARSKKFTNEDISTITPFLDVCSKLLIKTIDCRDTLASKVQRANTADEAKDRFLATMSHELRTPLNGILGMVTLLPDAGPVNDKQAEYIKNLTECAVELTSLLNNILDFSKMAADRFVLRKQPTNIISVVKDVVKIVEGNLLSKGLNLQLHTPDYHIPIMMGDSQRLAQILTNLLGNAAKFTDVGSIDVTVSASVLSQPSKLSNDFATAKKWKILFTVKDTGIGIPYDEQDKIFEVFHQSSSLSTYLSKSGTGLGLSIARELVRLMGGKISVSSPGVPGEGSTFTFYIILDEEINISGLSSARAGALEGARVLVVDDRSEMRLQISDMLFKWKCIPQAVSSAEEALQYLQYGMVFKLVLVDICMPNMSGVELAQELRMKYPHLPLIGISSVEISSGEEYFDYYMYKPVNQNTLFPAVLNCLHNPRNRVSTKKRVLRSRSHLKILVAEDDFRNAYTIREMLLNLGYKEKNIKIVSDGKECVDAVIEAKDGHPDVILMDIIMPKMDGLQASRNIKQLPNPPMIIAVSAAVQPSDKANCQSAGIDGYLSKPLVKEKLDAALNPLIRPPRKGRSISEKKGGSTLRKKKKAKELQPPK